MAETQDNPELPLLYANMARIAMNYTDVRIFFGETVPVLSSEAAQPGLMIPVGNRIVDRLCVVVSPEVLPQLARGFQDAIKNYEASFGPLRSLPKGAPFSGEAKPAP
jgi:hypothetical protein